MFVYIVGVFNPNKEIMGLGAAYLERRRWVGGKGQAMEMSEVVPDFCPAHTHNGALLSCQKHWSRTRYERTILALPLDLFEVP